VHSPSADGGPRRSDPDLQMSEVKEALQLGYSIAEREALFASLQPLVRRLIRQYGADPELRQDLPGEIYYRFCEFLQAYDPGRGIPLKPYLINKLSASVYTYVRSQWRRERREVGLDVEAGAALVAQAEPPPAEWEQEMLLADVIRALPEVIAQVPLRQRQVVVARFYEGRSFEDIAEALSIRPATARSLLRHGLNRMRQHLATMGNRKE
jgi:RNA polymerase sigma factor (sigma-70 family)